MKRLISFLIRYVPRKYLQLFSGWGLKFLGFFYAGNAVECPVCNHTYKRFLPYGRIKSRPNALCPSCQSLERHRLIWLYLKTTNFFTQPLDVLHIAPESCFMKHFEKQHGEKYITADIESPLAKVKMDLHQIPFEDNRFDVVLCNHVLEHVDNDLKALKEIFRTLRPGGWAILQVPFFSPVPDKTFEDNIITDLREREKIFGQSDHVRKYGKDYAERISSTGFKVIADGFAKNLPEAEVQKYGVTRNEIIYKAVKP